MKKIKSISFLFEDERVILLPNDKGRFELPTYQRIRNTYKTGYKETRVMEIVKHKEISDLDPVITLENGEKVRVYQGGDGSYMMAHPAGIIEQFDKFLWSHNLMFLSPSGSQTSFPWPDYLDW